MTQVFSARRVWYSDPIFWSIEIKSGTSPKVHIFGCDPQIFGGYLGNHVAQYRDNGSRAGVEMRYREI